MVSTTTKRKRKVAKAKDGAPGNELLPTVIRQGTLSRWGNSLGIRIPQEAVDRLQLASGEQMQVEVGEDAITLRPARQRRRKWTLKAMLKGVKPRKVGGEYPWGPPV